MFISSYNTASGKMCCNLEVLTLEVLTLEVTIPQAVRCVATVSITLLKATTINQLQYRKR